MQTLLDVSGTQAQVLVKLAAGLPGGIGNTGGECGGVTASLVLLGLHCGRATDKDGLPVVVSKGQDLLRRFAAGQGTLSCREIRRDARIPLRCISAIRQAPVLCARTMCSDCAGSLSSERKEAYRRLYAHWEEKGFHCSHSVFHRLDQSIAVDETLLDASAGFVGGTVFAGLTCSALTAGIMALGIALGEIENSRLRVLRMIGTMAIGGNAFADERNEFNKIMNLGHRLARWFAAEFGSTQCHAITQCDLSTENGVRRYIEGGGTARCVAIARSVADHVDRTIRSAGAAGSGRPLR